MNSERIADIQSAKSELSIVTGAFGFSGRRIAHKLLLRGERVRTLTNHPDSTSPLHDHLEVAPLDFGNFQGLTQSMAGARVLYNTYWIRFAYGRLSHRDAVANTKLLIRAAKTAGVSRIVHVSITNPSGQSALPYFRGKAEVEEAIQSSSLPYAILRPAVLFGEEDILINNIAWMLRRFPVFAIPGPGEYRVQPIFVEDLAELAVDCGQRRDSFTVDAAGPEIYRYEDLVKLIGTVIRSRCRIVHLPPSIVHFASWMLGIIVDDVVLTHEEIKGLMADLLVSHRPPTGHTSLRTWIESHAQTIGSTYASELRRHYRPVTSTNGARATFVADAPP